MKQTTSYESHSPSFDVTIGSGLAELVSDARGVKSEPFEKIEGC
jgi:hypothetical protein